MGHGGRQVMQAEPKTLDRVYFIHPLWMPVYTVFCVLGSLPFLLITALVLHVSVASDVVFGFMVMAGGPLGDFLFRKALKKIMYPFPRVPVPMIYLWPLVGIVVMLLRPFE
jgi:hypothetical protein